MARVYNFSAGPAAIPFPVLQRIQEELLDWQGQGTSVMEISHRSEIFMGKVLTPLQTSLRKLMNIPDHYHVLLISCSTSHQFSMVPLNLLDIQPQQQADYFHTGIWSEKAIKEAQRYGEIHIASSSEKNNFTQIDSPDRWQLNPRASYVHYTPNETVHGLVFKHVPQTAGVPLVADMSSVILSQPVDVQQFGLIYAGAQKNMGISGLTFVIIREDLLGKAKHFTPNLYNYETYVQHHSLFNTPATFALYVASLYCEWLLTIGGVEAMAHMNEAKAKKLYNYIDQTDFYRNPVNPPDRSFMNVIYYLPTLELDKLFVKEAAEAGLIYLKGHKLVGGIRACLYNAMPESGVACLIDFMKMFEKRYG